MTTLEFILDGLEDALELERELGVRSVECDRSLLTPPVSHAPATVPPPQPKPSASSAAPRPPSVPTPAPQVAPTPSDQPRLVFVHHVPLTPEGQEFITVGVRKLGLDPACENVVTSEPLPPAKVVVVLGGKAAKMFFPTVKASPETSVDMSDGTKVVVTYSPLYLLRFKGTPDGLLGLKLSLWKSLKIAKQSLYQ